MQLEVVTPKGSSTTVEADEVTAPGVRGEFGVLPGHTPFVSALRPGVVRWKQKGGKSGVIAVGAGYAEVSGKDRVVILAQDAQTADAIDAAAAQKDLDDATSALKDATGAARDDLELKRQWAQARVDAKAALRS
jgi:F-type H+-transporting ATPase subunit epsilon